VASLLFHVIYTRLTLSVMGIKLRAAVLSYFQQLNCHLQSCLLILSVTYNESLHMLSMLRLKIPVLHWGKKLLP